MRLSHIFERLLLQEILKMGKSRTGRPAKLGDEEALKCVFKVLRTGMQWREVDASVSFVTVFRRFQAWSKNNVFQNAYKRTIEVYRKLIPSKYYCIDSSYVKNKYGQQCGAHPTLKRMVKKRREDGSVEVKEKEIRGLRVCQNECCKLFMNRDKMGSINIATNFERLTAGKPPIRHLSKEEEELNQLQCSLCSEK